LANYSSRDRWKFKECMSIQSKSKCVIVGCTTQYAQKLCIQKILSMDLYLERLLILYDSKVVYKDYK
jgi:hypothetical protein